MPTFWSVVAEQSGDTALAATADRSAENQSGVALRFPPQSKNLALLLSTLGFSPSQRQRREIPQPKATPWEPRPP